MRAKSYITSITLVVALVAGSMVGAQQTTTNPPSNTTTTTGAPPPTPTPVPGPDPHKCQLETQKPSLTVNNYNFASCIVSKFSAYVKVAENGYVEFAGGSVNMNESRCESATENPNLVVDFDCGQLSFLIDKNNNSEIYIKELAGIYRINGQPQANFNSHAQKLFVTSESGHYYKCNAEQEVPVGTSNQSVTLVISNFSYEAYRSATGTDFYKIAEECALDQGPFSDGVRIGVGVCLVAFVAIILIAYFVGRRRWSQRSSYESV